MSRIRSAAIIVIAISNLRYGVDSAGSAVVANGLDDVVVPVGDSNPSEFDANSASVIVAVMACWFIVSVFLGVVVSGLFAAIFGSRSGLGSD